MNMQKASQEYATRPDDERFQTLAELRASVDGRRSRSREDFVEGDVCVSFDPASGGLSVSGGDLVPSTPTHWAFGQIAQAAGAPASYIRSLPAPMGAMLLNHGLSQAQMETRKTLSAASEDGETSTLRRFASEKYATIWDSQVVEQADRIVSMSDGAFFNPPDWSGTPSGLYASDRDVFMFFVDGGSIVNAGRTASGKDDVLHRGFFLWNSEVGAATMGFDAFLFRVVCGNHMIHGGHEVGSVRIRHTGTAPDRFAREVFPALRAHVEASPAADESTIRRAQNFMLPKSSTPEDKEIIDWLMEHKLTRVEACGSVRCARREEGDARTLWQVYNGATAYARGISHTDTRVDFERRAGKMFDHAIARVA